MVRSAALVSIVEQVNPERFIQTETFVAEFDLH
jgi:hypothetical protein